MSSYASRPRLDEKVHTCHQELCGHRVARCTSPGTRAGRQGATSPPLAPALPPMATLGIYPAKIVLILRVKSVLILRVLLTGHLPSCTRS
jgi:hypothetical protein